jgi:serine/threonine protein kinase
MTDIQNTKLRPGQFIGDYEIIKLVGRGGMAEVYAASQPRIVRRVAIKVIVQDADREGHAAERFAREARALALLEHPHILPIIDYGAFNGFNYIVMRLIEEGSLEDRIKDNGPLSLLEIGYLLERLGSALDYAHGKGVIHRDLKPSNILLDAGHNPYITDFGIAKLVGEDRTNLSNSGTLLGTPAYMSPEQLQSLPVTARSDNYSLGILTFEMLMGELPIKSDTPYGYIYRYVNEDLPVTDRVTMKYNHELAQVVQKAVTRDPEQRYQTAGEFAAEFIDACSALLGDASQLDNDDTLLKRPGMRSRAARTPKTEDELPSQGADEPVQMKPLPAHKNDETIIEQPENIVGAPPPPTLGTPVIQRSASRLHEPLPTKSTLPPMRSPDRVSRPQTRESQARRTSSTPTPASSQRPVSKEQEFASNLTIRIPSVCPVCLKLAHKTVKVRYALMLKSQPILFCDEHAKAFRAVSLPYVVAHVGILLLLLGSFIVASWLGPLFIVGLYIVFSDTLTTLQSEDTNTSRKAVRISRHGSKIRFNIARSRYAAAFDDANRK